MPSPDCNAKIAIVCGRLGLDRLQSSVNHGHDVTASSSLSQSECPIRNHTVQSPDAESERYGLYHRVRYHG